MKQLHYLTITLIFSALLLAGCQNADTGALVVGDPAPEFTLPSTEGSEVSLSDYQGSQPVLLFFHMAMG